MPWHVWALPVDLVGGLGEDHLGDWMAEQLSDVGVGMASVRRYAGKGTATTLILSDMQQNRLAFHHEGANSAVDGSAFDDDRLRRSHTLLLTSYSIMPGLAPSRRGRSVPKRPPERHTHSRGHRAGHR